MRISMLLLVAFGVAASNMNADLILTLQDPNQIAIPGEILTFTGTLLNSGTSRVFLNSADVSLSGNNFSVDFLDSFLNNVPPFLDPGVTTLQFDLFEVTVSNRPADPSGVFSGAYTFLGGIDAGAQDVLSGSTFSITLGTAPEPHSFGLVTMAILVFLVIRLRYFAGQ